MTPPALRRCCAVALSAAAVAGLAACGSGDEDSAGSTPEATATEPASGGGATLEIDATEDGGLGFSETELTAKAGQVTLTMANPDGNQFPHAVDLEGQGVDEAGDTVQPGGESTVTADLKPGTYDFYCPVGDHRQQGMEGTLTVD